MRKIFITSLFLWLCLGAMAAERIYVKTDRGAYLSGDMVYCSLFVVGQNGPEADFPAAAYVELISTDGTAAEAKIGLFEGRGAGSFRIPRSVPTGNYRLVAYTAAGNVSEDGSRIISVFNPSSTARVAGGVKIVQKTSSPVAEDLSEGGLRISLPARLHEGRDATLVISADEASDIAVSVYHEDGLARADGISLSSFLGADAASPVVGRTGEYEGEIIEANVEGLVKNSTGDDKVTAWISTAGDPSNVYIGKSDADGKIRFHTGNIYGDRELVCEVVSLSGQSCHIAISSPFVHPSVSDIPQLELCPSQREALVSRKAALKAEAKTRTDTLVRFLPRRRDLLLADAPEVSYHLEDYTRFQTIRETCTEIAHEIDFVKRSGRWMIRMIVEDGTSSRKYVRDNILVLMDGVVITDHGMLEDFDAGLIADVDIYTRAVALGGVSYNGVVNFISKKNYVTALHFPDNVRVVDFKGFSYPVAYPGEAPSGNEDRRELLFWHPALDVPAGGQERITLHTPSYAGTFRVVAEGWTKNGTPVRAEYTFSVE